MISFESDYIMGAHPKILEKLTETNMEPLSGYGSDKYCQSAIEKIKEACKCPNAQVHFLAGGTQTNSVVISNMLNAYQGVVAADTGHVSIHEAGAIEYTGHKVLTVPNHKGKIDGGELREYLHTFYSDDNREHMVFPGMVYISHPTEYGTLYSKCELESLANVCKEYEILLYMDGARLGYGLMSKETDVTLADVAHLCDVFYIGGTKMGALCGEAVVFTGNNAPKHFTTMVKQQGALLAKGRLLGVQFDTLFTDGLYEQIGAHGIEMAEKLKGVLRKMNMSFYLESPTNQQFVILDNEVMKKLAKEVSFSFWEKVDDGNTVVRFATSWSTTDEDIAKLESALKSVLDN